MDIRIRREGPEAPPGFPSKNPSLVIRSILQSPLKLQPFHRSARGRLLLLW